MDTKPRAFRKPPSGENFRYLVENFPHGIYQSTKDGRLLSANPAFVRMLAYRTEAELLEVDLARDVYLHPEDREACIRRIEQDGKLVDTEVVLRRKDGRQVTVVDNARVMRDPHNKFTYYQGIIKDVTEQRALEQKLKDSEARFRGIAERSIDGIFEMDLEGRLTYVSPSAQPALGYKPEEMVGTHVERYLPESEIPKIAPHLALLIQGKHVIGLEGEMLRKDGSHVWAELNASPILRDGTVVGVQGIIRDITERKRAEENLERMVAERTAELAESQHQLQLIADSLPALISYVDSQQRYVFNNKTYEEWFGQSTEATIGRHISEVLGEQAYGRIRERMEAALSGARQSFEYELPLSSGTRRLSATYIPDFGEHGEVKGVFVLGIDITERVMMEERLLKAERLAAIGETAAMVGHDLRNPLQAISAATYVLERKMASGEDGETREMLGVITDSVGYSDSIVSDLLDYSQDLRLRFTETTPRSLAGEALQQVKTPSNITVSDWTTDDPKIRVDAIKIRRIFINLIDNAIDAMPTGGQLTLSSKRSNNEVEIQFKDTGKGIPENVLRELWKPLTTDKPKGMGLGLAICKRFAEAHGGSITVTSQVGQGTTFTLRLPIQPNRERPGLQETAQLEL